MPNIDPSTATALLTAAVAVGIFKAVDLAVWWVKRRNGKDEGPVTRLDCLKGQLRVKERIGADIAEMNKNLKEGLEKFTTGIRRHEDTWHRENSQPPHIGPGV